MIKYQPEESSPLYKLWPDGVEGEMTYTGMNMVHLRVKLEDLPYGQYYNYR